MSGRARLRHRRQAPRQWPAIDTPMCAAFLRALAAWIVAHHDDRDATVILPTGRAGVEELARVLRGLERARQEAVS